jgi:hypothetical protein
MNKKKDNIFIRFMTRNQIMYKEITPKNNKVIDYLINQE